MNLSQYIVGDSGFTGGGEEALSRCNNVIGNLLEVISYATQKHGHQTRKSTGLPFIIHPIGVARDIATIGKVSDPLVIQAAILHDVLEDTSATEEELTKLFGEKVCQIVKEVTDDKSLNKAERKRLQIEHASHISSEAKIVKLSDKLYNLRDLIRFPIWDDERTQGYVVWAYFVIKPMRGTNPGLEAALDEVLSWYLPSGVPALPSTDPLELELLLQAYLQQMAQL